MNKTIITAALVLITGFAASAQNNRTNNNIDKSKAKTSMDNSQLTEKDTVLDRSRWDNPDTDDPNTMKAKPGTEIQMSNGTRQEQREFKNTEDTLGRREKLPRR